MTFAKSNSKRRPGRPKGDGWQDAEFIAQMLNAVFIFNRGRRKGLGYDLAIDEAASWIRYSRTKTKRLLAMSRNGRIGFVVIKEPTEEEIRNQQGEVEFGIGEVPVYPRLKSPRRKRAKR